MKIFRNATDKIHSNKSPLALTTTSRHLWNLLQAFQLVSLSKLPSAAITFQFIFGASHSFVGHSLNRTMYIIIQRIVIWGVWQSDVRGDAEFSHTRHWVLQLEWLGIEPHGLM